MVPYIKKKREAHSLHSIQFLNTTWIVAAKILLRRAVVVVAVVRDTILCRSGDICMITKCSADYYDWVRGRRWLQTLVTPSKKKKKDYESSKFLNGHYCWNIIHNVGNNQGWIVHHNKYTYSHNWDIQQRSIHSCSFHKIQPWLYCHFYQVCLVDG